MSLSARSARILLVALADGRQKSRAGDVGSIFSMLDFGVRLVARQLSFHDGCLDVRALHASEELIHRLPEMEVSINERIRIRRITNKGNPFVSGMTKYTNIVAVKKIEPKTKYVDAPILVSAMGIIRTMALQVEDQ
jgi:hypothetical protein